MFHNFKNTLDYQAKKSIKFHVYHGRKLWKIFAQFEGKFTFLAFLVKTH